ncbi:MAG: chromosome segregation protein SMC [Acidimicrobiaceae bacterium]|nr:chromosome segregation protein SMC [Acidimicrobiaceae bacterium]
MFLRSLTIKGFKSFADPVTIDLSPGVSVIVGPNGSGKSNIADAISWVLGAQGPKTVRSSKMDEVIFAGAGRRGPLGRAEVSIVIDNSDRGLELDLSEVNITRTLFRSGESEYYLNGNPCRLMDLQDLLSDAGVGRQQHVIISQGQLDLILSAKSEERRAVVEESAGITKFKKRRERTERRLEAMEGDLLRAEDLVREVRRQIRPLAQQAAKAKRQLELRDRHTLLKRYIAGSEMRALESVAEAAAKEQLESELAVLEIQNEIYRVDQAITAWEGERPVVGADDLFDSVTRSEALTERLRSTVTLAKQKRQTLADRLRANDRSTVIESLRDELTGVSTELSDIEGQIVELASNLEKLESDEARFKLEETPEITDLLQELNDRFSELTSENGLLESRRSTLAETVVRIRSQKEGLESRKSRFHGQLAAKRSELNDVNVRISELSEQLEQKSSQYALGLKEEKSLRQQLDEVEVQYSGYQLEVNSLMAKVAAYEAAIEEGRSKTQAKALAQLSGFLGALVDVIDINSGYESAFAAAVQNLVSSVLTKDQKSALAALIYLKSHNLHGSVISVSQYARNATVDVELPGLPFISLRSQVSTSGIELSNFFDLILLNTFVVPGSLDEAIDYHRKFPQLIFVTLDGERLGPDGLWTASKPMQGTGLALERTVNALKTSENAFYACEADLHRIRDVSSLASAASDLVRQETDGLREELARLETLPERLVADIEVAMSELENLRREEVGLSQREADAASELDILGPQLRENIEMVDTVQSQIALLREKMKEQFSMRKELDGRGVDLELKATRLEQARIGLARERESISLRLATEMEAQESSVIELSGWRRSIIGLDHVIYRSSELEMRASNLSSLAKEERVRLVNEAKLRSERLDEARRRRSRLESDLDAKREALQINMIRSSETKVRLETMGERIRRELGIETEIAKSTPIPEGVSPTQAEYVLKQVEEGLSDLGPINELAEIELAELTEKSKFLELQLEDIRTSRRDLGKVIRSIDAEMLQVFHSAFNDVADKFSRVFEQLFQGGKGRLILTQEDDPLQSGLEIEVSLPGKSVKKLSLLSGGERSLIALAFLFSIFEARPSPFYILDEVEAALDDINLNRFLKLITSFGKTSQLLIISHQKRTMEVADLLYGVTMPEGGSTKVVSQRMSRVAKNAI